MSQWPSTKARLVLTALLRICIYMDTVGTVSLPIFCGCFNTGIQHPFISLRYCLAGVIPFPDAFDISP